LCEWAQGTFRFTVIVDIKEGKMAVPLGLHSELNVLMDTVQVAKELRQLAWTVGPDDGRVVHLAEPLKSRSMKNLPMTGDDGEPTRGFTHRPDDGGNTDL
jgi:hypothetical protein